MRKKLGISDSTVVLGHVGRFEKEKNHEFLLDVFARYLLKNSDSFLILIGVGSLFEEVKEKADKLGVIDKSFMKKYRRHAIVVILIIAAIITPTTDIFTLTIVTLPIYLLYELSIHIVKR